MSTEFDYGSFPWSEHFKLDPESPSGLAWNRVAYSFGGNKLETWVGKPAGTLREVKNKGNKAWGVSLRFDGKQRSFAVHRIIAVLHGLSVNGKVIDHINGISADNHIENLKVTTQAINSRNCKPGENCPYGIQGVSSQSDRKGNLYFIARTNHLGKRVQKNFPVKTLGIMEAFKQAVIARHKMIAELNANGAGYSERHSKVEQEILDFASFEQDYSLVRKTTRVLRKRRTNTSGAIGVSWDSDEGRNTRAIASWIERNEDGKKVQRAKYFSVLKYGLLPAFAEAFKYRQSMIAKLNEQGYGYTELETN